MYGVAGALMTFKLWDKALEQIIHKIDRRDAAFEPVRFHTVCGQSDTGEYVEFFEAGTVAPTCAYCLDGVDVIGQNRALAAVL